MNWKIPELEQFKQWIDQAFDSIMSCELGTADFKARYVVAGWANVNDHGDYNASHIHSNSHWSGVYYVDIGKPISSRLRNGAIEFLDPRSAVGVYDYPTFTSSGKQTIQPETGLMLLFPSWLRHTVLPYYGKSARITVAFNLRVDELSVN